MAPLNASCERTSRTSRTVFNMNIYAKPNMGTTASSNLDHSSIPNLILGLRPPTTSKCECVSFIAATHQATLKRAILFHSESWGTSRRDKTSARSSPDTRIKPNSFSMGTSNTTIFLKIDGAGALPLASTAIGPQRKSLPNAGTLTILTTMRSGGTRTPKAWEPRQHSA